MISKNIKWLRQSFGLALKDVSRLTKIKVSTLSSYEERDVTPKADTLLELWNLFKPAFDFLEFNALIDSDLSEMNLSFDPTFFNKQKTTSGHSPKTFGKIPQNANSEQVIKLISLFDKMLDQGLLNESSRIDVLFEKLIDMITIQKGVIDSTTPSLNN